MEAAKATNERPREKLQKYGVSRLNDSELIQLLISSGTRTHKVGSISRKVLKIIKNSNADVTYQALVKIPGMGQARVSQILALFELASRYPMKRREQRLDDVEAVVEYLASQISKHMYTVMTIDGAGYLINSRKRSLKDLSDTTILHRYAIKDACTDDANGVIVHINTPLTSISPTMLGIQLARGLQQTGRILGIRIRDVIVSDGSSSRSVLGNLHE